MKSKKKTAVRILNQEIHDIAKFNCDELTITIPYKKYKLLINQASLLERQTIFLIAVQYSVYTTDCILKNIECMDIKDFFNEFYDEYKIEVNSLKPILFTP